MRAVVIGPEEQKKLEALKAFAEKNVIPFARILRGVSGAEPPIGRADDRHKLELPGGLFIVYSVEDQPCGECRHVSMSVLPHVKDVLPNPALVACVLPYLGFVRPMSKCKVWVEKDLAINVMEPVDANL